MCFVFFPFFLQGRPPCVLYESDFKTPFSFEIFLKTTTKSIREMLLIKMMILYAATLLRLLLPVHSCKLQGTDSGVCTYQYLPETYQNDTTDEKRARQISQEKWACEDASTCAPFCGRFIAAYYPVCVPTPNPYPNRQFNHTIIMKDRWVEEQFNLIVSNRFKINTESRSLGVDDDEEKRKSDNPFHKNKACQDAYKRYFCWLNFPRCGELLYCF